MIDAKNAKVFVFLLVIWLAVGAAAQADTWQARVTNISDGDTITVITPAGQQERIRFYGIDAPETGQHFGRAIDSIFGAISGALANGDKMAFPGFGTLEVRDRTAKEGRNLQTAGVFLSG